MKSDLNCRLASEHDRSRILDLFRASYGRELSEEFWKWRFRDCPAGNGTVALVMHGSTIVSHYAVTPVFFSIDGGEVLTGLAGTTMTDPAYRGQGLFVEAAKFAYDDLRRRSVCFVWGFPNNQIH